MIKSSPSSAMLILCDGDSLSIKLPTLPSDALVSTDEMAHIGPYRGNNLGAVVCIAFNQSNMLGDAWTFDGLRKFAFSMARRCGVTADVVCELAPCLTVPESVDIALARLFFWAPCESHTGPFSKLVLISKDKGLRSFLKENIPTPCHFLALPRITDAIRYSLEEKKYQRKFCPPRTTGSVITPAIGWSVPIERAEHAMWASTQTMGTTLGNFRDLSNKLEEEPFLLSQLSTTTTSTRGVIRCVPTTTPYTLGEISEKDGVVMKNLGLSPTSPITGLSSTSVENASIGSGAIHLRSHHVTLRTDLPAAVIQQSCDITGRLEISGGRVDDTATLHYIPDCAEFGEEFLLDIKSHPEGYVRCKIEYDHRKGLPAWWYVDEKSIIYQNQPIPRGDLSIKLSIKVTAKMIRLGNDIVMAAPSRISTITLTNDVAPTRWGKGYHKHDDVVVLALGRTLQKGTHDVIRIQDRSFPPHLSSSRRWRSEYWPRLQRFPLVIPKCQIFGEQCVCKEKG